jgi:hypothetical protein
VAPAAEFYAFAAQLQNDTYDVYVVVDDNQRPLTIHPRDAHKLKDKIVRLDERVCVQRGFYGSLLYNKKPCARDKALCFLASLPFDHAWLLEEDVFVPSTTTLASLDAKYPTGDLLCKEFHHLLHTPRDFQPGWHWAWLKPQIHCPLPWAATMICAARLSAALVHTIARYAATHRRLFLDEALFPTLALQAKLDIQCIPELNHLLFQDTTGTTDIHNIQQMCLYHPVKNMAMHDLYREFTAFL